MRNLLIYIVKLMRDANYKDKEIAEAFEMAAKQIREGRFWPSDINQNYTR